MCVYPLFGEPFSVTSIKRFPISVKLIIVLTVIFITPSCKNGRRDLTHTAEIVAKVDISQSDDAFDVRQFADLERLIPLRAEEGAFVGEIDKLEMDGNHIVILDRKMRTVWLFGADGKFIRRIGRFGNGPKEYVSLDDILFDSESGTVWIWDRIKQTMLEYGLSGELKKQLSTGFITNKFTKTQAGFWLYYSFLKNPDNNSLILVNDQMDRLVSGYFPTKESFPVSSNSGFTSRNGKSFFYFPLSNIIYSLDGDEAVPYIEFDFGAQTLPYSRIKDMTKSEYDDIIEAGSYLGDLRNVVMSDGYCFFKFSSTVKNKYITDYFGVLDMRTGKVKTYSSVTASELLVDFSSILCVTKENQLVYPIYPGLSNPIYYDDLRKLLPDVTEDSDPILAVYKLK